MTCTNAGDSQCTQCEPGRYGPSCQECPTGASTPCSNNGLCDDGIAGTGTCSCNTGYTGTDCDQCAADYFGYPGCTACSPTCPAGTGINAGTGAECNASADRVCDACALGDANDGSSLSCSTTIAVCPTTVDTTGCYEAGAAKFQYSEKVNGKEKMKMQWKAIGAPSYEDGFGDPVGGTASVAVCVYDEVGVLAAEMVVDRAGRTCAGVECWKVKGSKAYGYKDKENSADGISKLDFPQYLDENAKQKAGVKGKNNLTKSQLTLPTDVVDVLTGKTSSTIQLRTSYGFCTSATVTKTADDGVQYKAEKK